MYQWIQSRFGPKKANRRKYLKRLPAPPPIRSIIADIKYCTSKYDFHICFCPRIANKVGDWLAKAARRLQ
ncbi:hypothetical protein Tsubulata_037545 [Turnera subulata]|uniref:Uncharacterized protein n=1 Tax=Turnera subulata TaxID=218843 RepID=A0A9Q0JKT7_9ROSI|nr:hypothetical protein Tsubulata_037545 [Turnera subulata]